MAEINRNLARATLLNLSGFMVPVVVQLATVPLYIKVIGIDRYGVMSLVWLLLGYFGFFDLGFGRAIASAIAGLTTNPAARERIFWTGTCLSVVTGAAGGLVLYLVATKLFQNVLAVPSGLLGETRAALPFMALALPVVTAVSALSGALQGREAFGALNFSQMTGSILYQVFPLLVAGAISAALPGLVIAAILGRLVTAVMLLVFCLRRVPARPFPRICVADIMPLLRYGGWVTITGLISPLLTVFDRFVIGTVTGMAAVTAYTIPYNLVMRLASLPGSFQNALFPRFAMIDQAGAHALQAQAVKIVSCLMTPLLVIGLILMKPFLIFWVGGRLAETAAPVGEILIVGLWFNTVAYIPFGFLQSRGRPDIPAKFHIAELLFYAPALFFLTRHFGVAGAAWAWDARALADAVLLLAAVDLMNGLIAGWPGLMLVGMSFAWVWLDVASLFAYWGISFSLLTVSVVWTLRHLPPEMRRRLMPRFATRRKALVKP